MHSLSPYSIRVFDGSLSKTQKEKYHLLNKVGSYDVYALLKEFIKKYSSYEVGSKEKFIFKFENIKFNDQKRIVYGWLNLGKFGTKHDIVNTENGNTDYVKQTKHADMTKHFFHISLPLDRDDGIVLFHSFRRQGIKTYFYDYFNDFFKERVKLNIQLNPLSNAEAFKAWEKASTQEIRLVKFDGADDLSDKLKGLGHIEKFMTIKPPKKSIWGKFKDVLEKDSELYKAVEILDPLCARVKVVVNLNGKKRTFVVGNNSSNSICEIEAPKDLKLTEGHPEYNSILKWFTEVSKEYVDALY